MSAPRLDLLPYARPLLAPVRGRVTRRGWLVRLTAGDLVGWGEAACWPGFGGGARATRRALRSLDASTAGGLVDAARARDLDGLERALTRAGALTPEARHALELAALDLTARAAGLPLSGLLAPAPRASVAVHALVHDGAGAAAAVAAGATTLKLKVGGAAWPQDLARAAAVRAAAPAARLRVDANGAWSGDEAPARLRALADLGVALVEQPTPAGDVQALRRARAQGGVRVAVDEGLRDARDLEALLAAAAVDAVVLKPQALGGLLPARRLARRAAAAGLEVVVTHSLEAAIGRAGGLALAAGLAADVGPAQPEEPVHGLGPALARDVAALPQVAGGRAPLPAGAGLGVSADVGRSSAARSPALVSARTDAPVAARLAPWVAGSEEGSSWS